MLVEIPAHQVCTDCRKAKRALANGITGYGCLCQECWSQRMDNAKDKCAPKVRSTDYDMELPSPEKFAAMEQELDKIHHEKL